MKSIITASIVFSFKGKTFSPSLTLELDAALRSGGHVPDLYPLIAKENNIDLYSYEYEMMQAEAIRIDSAQGLVAEYVADGQLHTEAFVAAWHEQQKKIVINTILEQDGLVHLLEQYPEIEQTLLAIYQAGEARHK